MLSSMRALPTVAALLLFPILTLASAGDEMVDNPLYKAWASFKPGSSVTLSEKTIFGDDRKPFLPDGIEEKLVMRKLLSVSPEKVVVQTLVTEHEFFGTVESAPTKTTYTAKIKKAYLAAVMEEHDAKAGEETIKVLGKETKCRTLTGVNKKDDVHLDFKMFLSETIPGAVVHRTRITRHGTKLVAETVITLKDYLIK